MAYQYKDYEVTLVVPVRIYDDDPCWPELEIDTIDVAQHVYDSIRNVSPRWVLDQIRSATLTDEGEEEI
jgi:hypothetical protein